MAHLFKGDGYLLKSKRSRGSWSGFSFGLGGSGWGRLFGLGSDRGRFSLGNGVRGGDLAVRESKACNDTQLLVFLGNNS